jgi:4-hydroxy-3-methylbut-2-en-1-yl diphosphate synthase IspG/GcpE
MESRGSANVVALLRLISELRKDVTLPTLKIIEESLSLIETGIVVKDTLASAIALGEVLKQKLGDKNIYRSSNESLWALDEEYRLNLF